MVVPEGQSSSPSTARPERHVLTAVIGLVCLVAGWVLGSGTSTNVTSGATTSTQTSVPVSTSGSAPLVGPTEPSTTSVPALPGAVDVRPSATALDGSVAFAVGGEGVSTSNLWMLLPGGRLIERVDVPVQFVGVDYPMLIVGDHLLFVGPNALYSMSVDLTDPPQPLVVGSSFLIQDSKPASVWIVGGKAPDWFARSDGQILGEETQVNGFGWPYRGFGDGLQFAPHSPDLGDGYFVWRPGGEPEPLGLDLSPQTGFYEEWGGLVAEVSRGSEIYLVDIVTGQITTTLPFDPGEGLVGGVCFSPDGTYLAAVSSAGPGEIFRVSTGDPVGSFTTSDPNWGIGWTSDSQLAFIEETPSGSRLSLFDTGTSTTIGIAELGAPGFWGVATSGPVC